MNEAGFWCYYAGTRDGDGRETGGPAFCSEHRPACESVRLDALAKTPAPSPKRAGRSAVSGECYFLRSGS